MSAKRLPARPSVAQLRKQAKELLAALRVDDPTSKLSEAQLALARAYGFPSWPKLVAHVDEVRGSARIDHFERLADDMLAGYGGDRAALERLIAYFGVSYDEGQVRSRLRRRIDDARDAPDAPPTIAEVRRMVAREFGHVDWDALASALAAPGQAGPPSSGGASAGPPFYAYDPESDTIEPRGPLSVEDWRRLAALMSERGVSRLRATSLTDAAIEALADVESLVAVDAEGAQGLTDDGVLRLERLGGLRELSLGGYHSPLGDAAMDVLEALPELRSFRMAWAQGITDRGAAKLAHCPRLERVDLMGTPTGDATVRALAGHEQLRRLATGRALTDEGVGALSLLPWFARPPVEPIALDTMSFSPGPGALLLDGDITDAGLARLSSLKGLQALDLFRHAAKFTPAGLGELAGVPSLAYLGCPGERCTDEAMAAIAGIPSLRMLMAQGAVASDLGFEALAGSGSLELFWGRECPNLGDAGFMALAGLRTLRGMGVGLANVSRDAMAAFADFPSLEELVPIHVDDRGFESVGRVSRLERLWCMYCRETGDAATDAVAHLALRTYYAGSTKITDRSLEVLATIGTLEEIELVHTSAVTGRGIAALRSLPHLRRLEMTGLPRVRAADARGFRDGVRVRHVP